MSGETEAQILATLREIRDGQQELLAQLKAQRALAEAQITQSRERIDESMALQREALRRQRSITRMALPAILACIAAIVYLVLRYF